MDKNLEQWICENYNIDNPSECNEEEATRVKEIDCKEKRIETMEGLDKFKALEFINLADNNIVDFDCSPFPNLRKLDCSLNPIESLNLSQNHLLEEISFYGFRSNRLPQIDFSGNPHLKQIFGGQDEQKQIDLSNNPEIEKVTINLSSHLRQIQLTKCKKLSYISLWGVSVPYVDLTQNDNLEYVEINYLNTYVRKADVYGPGYPRPFIFVDENFNKEVINKQDRDNEYYTYVLVPTAKDSKEEKVLQKLNNMQSIIELEDVARFHYEIMGMLN